MSFWANKLNNEPVKTAPVPSRDLFSLYNSPAIPQQAPQQHSIPANQEYQPSVRLKEGGHCPGCGSDKYMQYGSYAIACGEWDTTHDLNSLAMEKEVFRQSQEKLKQLDNQATVKLWLELLPSLIQAAEITSIHKLLIPSGVI